MGVCGHGTGVCGCIELMRGIIFAKICATILSDADFAAARGGGGGGGAGGGMGGGPTTIMLFTIELACWCCMTGGCWPTGAATVVVSGAEVLATDELAWLHDAEADGVTSSSDSPFSSSE